MTNQKIFLKRLPLLLLLTFGLVAGCQIEEENDEPAPAEFTVSNLSIEPDQVEIGEEVTLIVDVTNSGGTAGTETLEFEVNGIVASEDVKLEPGQTETLSAIVTPHEAGMYEVRVDDLTASFEALGPDIFQIEAEAGPGGKIEPDGKVEVAEGENQAFSIHPDEGFEIADVVVDGQSVGAVSEYAFEAVAGDRSIRAEFEKEPVDVDLDCKNPYHPGLILLVATVDEVNYGASLPMAMVVTTSAYEQTHQFATSQRYDFSIYDEEGQEIWRWSDDQEFLMVVGQEVFTTEGILYFERFDTGELPAEKATYILKATLATEGKDGNKEGPAHLCTSFKVIPG